MTGYTLLQEDHRFLTELFSQLQDETISKDRMYIHVHVHVFHITGIMRLRNVLWPKKAILNVHVCILFMRSSTWGVRYPTVDYICAISILFT